MLKIYPYVICFLLISNIAFAQGLKQPDPVDALAPEWSAVQLAQQHFIAALTKVIEDTKATKITLDAERKYWAEYVKGLYQ